MTANGVPLTLGTTADGALTAQVDVPAESQMLIRLSYRVTVSDAPLVTIRYAPSVLAQVAGSHQHAHRVLLAGRHRPRIMDQSFA